MTDQCTACVITVSDRCSSGERKDRSGPVVAEILENMTIRVTRREIVPDDREIISTLLSDLADNNSCNLIVTTGGTGLAPRDVTPEATADVIDRRADGLTALMLHANVGQTPLAALSRGICGMRKACLIINLPGSPRGVEENLLALKDVLPHGLTIAKGKDPH